jgi:Domain of unknown function (DUF4307)
MSDTTTDQPAAPRPTPGTRMSWPVVAGVVAGVLVVLGLFWWGSNDRMPIQPATVKADTYLPLGDPSKVKVIFSVQGDGDTRAVCTVTAVDRSGATLGSDELEVEFAEDGETQQKQVTLSVPAAADVNDVNVRC